MLLYVAGSFGGANLRKQLYASGAKHVLSSNAWPNARETAEIIAKGDEVKLFLAALGNGDDNWAMAISARIHNLLCSFGHETSKMTADYFAPRNREEDMRIYQAGVPGDSVNAKLLIGNIIQNLLASFAAKQSQAAADHMAGLTEEDRMKLFIAGELSPKTIEDICASTGEQNLLCTNASEGSRDRAAYFALVEHQVKLFIAGNRGTEEIQQAEFEEVNARNLLYANGCDQGMETAKAFASKLASDFTPYHLLIDSGAFTAFKQGTPIVLADYIAYAKEMQAKAYCDIEFIALDVITPHGQPAEVLEQNCQQGYNNWKEMAAAGVPCIPTFHRGDERCEGYDKISWKWLDIFARELPAGSRFCIAPKVDGTRKEIKMGWLNQVFQRLEELNIELNAAQGTDHKLWERWLIHGLGISSQEIMEAYPWYSVDSTGWLSAAQTCDLRYFDGKTIRCLHSGVHYKDDGDTELSRLAQEHYRVAKNHKYDRDAAGCCRKCNWDCGHNPFDPEEMKQCGDACHDAHKALQVENEGLEAGAYWFGKEAIRADVQLARHVTQVWQARGVFFDGEARLDTTGFSTSTAWHDYREGEQRGIKYSPEHATFDFSPEE